MTDSVVTSKLTQKEAWKALSHKFHRKGSGKVMMEKRLKKIGDTPISTGSSNAWLTKLT
jgi:SART-1 family